MAMNPTNKEFSASVKAAYSHSNWVADYARHSHLQPPEETVLRLMLPHLPAARMLDLGVGGGRTTLHFAKWVREYVGTDYVESMIQECKKRFAGYPPHVSFRVCDARSMETFANNSFDFLLFSHNGIDSVCHEDRLKILSEIRRIGRPGGHFCFSSHNLNWCRNLFELRRMLSPNPRLVVQVAKRLVLRFSYNSHIRASAVRNSPHLVITMRAFNQCRFPYYFIRPLAQIAQLQEDFMDVRVFSVDTGAEIQDRSQLETVEDPWLYYLCKMK